MRCVAPSPFRWATADIRLPRSGDAVKGGTVAIARSGSFSLQGDLRQHCSGDVRAGLSIVDEKVLVVVGPRSSFSIRPTSQRAAQI
jgi:hypothetical protein